MDRFLDGCRGYRVKTALFPLVAIISFSILILFHSFLFLLPYFFVSSPLLLSSSLCCHP